MKSKEYEYNVFVRDDRMVYLSAYEVKYLDNPENQEPVETNTGKYTTIGIPMTMEYYGEVAYLLGDPKWHIPKEKFEMVEGEVYTDNELFEIARYSWVDYDSWEGGEDWIRGLPTQQLFDFVNGLPEYEPEPAHEWLLSSTEVFEQLRLSPERPVFADVKCKNCDESYQIGKVF